MSLFSDYRFRGYSLSEGRPVAALDLSYDAPSGFYADASGSAVAAREGVRALGFQLDGGYAASIRPGLTIDIGATRANYSRYAGLARKRSYTEVYAGMSGKRLSTRLSISPDYLGSSWTMHGEIGAHVDTASRLRVDGAIGLLVPLTRMRYGGYAKPVYDARLGVSRSVGRFTLHAAVTSRGADRDRYLGRRSSRSALVIGISTAL